MAFHKLRFTSHWPVLSWPCIFPLLTWRIPWYHTNLLNLLCHPLSKQVCMTIFLCFLESFRSQANLPHGSNLHAHPYLEFSFFHVKSTSSFLLLHKIIYSINLYTTLSLWLWFQGNPTSKRYILREVTSYSYSHGPMDNLQKAQYA